MKGLVIGLAIGLAVSFVMIHYYNNRAAPFVEKAPQGPTYEELVDAYIAQPNGDLFTRLAYPLGGLGEPDAHSIEFFAHGFNRLVDRDLLMMLFDYRSAWDPDTHELIDNLQAVHANKAGKATPWLGLTSEDARVVQTCYVRLVARMLTSESSAISYLLQNGDQRSCREHAFTIGDARFTTYPLPERLQQKEEATQTY